MKTIIIQRIIAIAAPILFFSCENFTEVDLPQSQLAGEAVYQSTSTANAALADLYARIRENGFASGSNISATALLGNYSDDLSFYGGTLEIQQFNHHTLLPSNSYLSHLWNYSYEQVYGANLLMEGVQNSSAITGEDRYRLIGEALFLRCYVHFYLASLFGDVPYVTTTDYNANASISKTPPGQVYDLILGDLSQAESLLPDSYPTTGRVRANKAVVTAMKARVYLYKNDWAQAESHATAIINNTEYAWEPDPDMVFLKDSPSIIWSLHPGNAGLNTLDAMTFALLDGPPSKPSISESLYNAFEPGDVRKTLWIKTVTDGTNEYYQPFKYKNDSSTPASEEYTIVFRLAEQYLIRAEARAQMGNISGAQEDLNMTRNRAGLPDTTASTTDQLLTAILNERRFEFFTEQGHRWLDLKRTGSAAAALGTIKPGWQNSDVLLPIPATELLLNNNLLPQNPGY